MHGHYYCYNTEIDLHVNDGLRGVAPQVCMGNTLTGVAVAPIQLGATVTP